jgi:hypothetical protein
MNHRIARSVRATGVSFVLIVASVRTGGGQLAGAAGIGASVPVQVGPFVVEAGAIANRIGSSVSPRTTLDVSSSLALPIGGSGFWLGGSTFQAREIDSLPVRPLLSAGLWHQFSSVVVSLGAQSHVARLGGHAPRETVTRVADQPPSVMSDTNGSNSVQSYHLETSVDSGAPSSLEAWSDMEAGASWTAGRFRLAAILGARPPVADDRRAVWGRMLAETQLASRIALSASIGVQPAQLAIGVPSSRFATIGLNVATWRPGQAAERAKAAATTFVVRKLDATQYRVEYHDAGAHSVEISGDFNNWTPVELHEVAPGEWQSNVSVAPGTYHMNVRVDSGRWNAPPGTVEVADDFNGTVGIVVIR